MRTVCLAACLIPCCVAAAAPVPAAAPAQETRAESALPALVHRFFAAEEAYDVPTLATLVSDRFVEISPAGEIDRRERFLGFYTPDRKQPWPAITLSDEEVRTFGDTAIEVAKQSFTVPGPDGHAVTREIRCSFTAQREGGVWKLIGTQYTGIRLVPPTPPKP